MGCGALGILECMRKFLLKRLGVLRLREPDSAHVGMELSQESDSSVTSTQLALTGNSLPTATSPSLWAVRPRPLGDEDKWKFARLVNLVACDGLAT